MRATGLILPSFDEPAALRPFEIAAPADDQLLIEVKAASVNAFDWKVADGLLKHAFAYEFPVVIGRDYSGVVREAGNGVTEWKPGDAVFGYLGGMKLQRGSFATHLLVGENASGEAEDETHLKDLGATEVHGRAGFSLGNGTADVLIDLVNGGEAFAQLLDLVKPGGRVVSVHRAADPAILAPRGLTGANVMSKPDRALLDELARLAAAGPLRVPIEQTRPLEDVAQALADAKTKHSRGKTVITI